MKQPTAEDVLSVAEAAKTWPTVSEAATRYGIPRRSLAHAIQAGRVVVFKTNVERVDPSSLAAWIASRQR